MDLTNVIMNAGAGLAVFRAQVATTSNNIANANTPGYARQDAVATETTPSEETGNNGYTCCGVPGKCLDSKFEVEHVPPCKDVEPLQGVRVPLHVLRNFIPAPIKAAATQLRALLRLCPPLPP